MVRIATVIANGRKARFPGTSEISRSWQPFSGIAIWSGPGQRPPMTVAVDGERFVLIETPAA